MSVLSTIADWARTILTWPYLGPAICLGVAIYVGYRLVAWLVRRLSRGAQ